MLCHYVLQKRLRRVLLNIAKEAAWRHAAGSMPEGKQKQLFTVIQFSTSDIILIKRTHFRLLTNILKVFVFTSILSSLLVR